MANPSGKTALITGASAGIGKDLAELFAADGHALILVARSQDRLEQLANDLKQKHSVNVEILPKDLSQPNSLKEIFDFVQSKNVKIEFLVNNAGFGSHGRFAESDVANELAMLQVNIVALTHLSRLFLPDMLQRGSGKIMNVASLAAFLPGPLMAVYYATKAYVLSFTQAIASEVSGSGVTITCLCPGPTTTEFQKRAGVENSLLFKKATMDSMSVARIGYHAMMSGRRTVVTGWKNKMLAFSTRLVPRRLAAALTRQLNASR
jgi:short-subunit dehydrogenase